MSFEDCWGVQEGAESVACKVALVNNRRTVADLPGRFCSNVICKRLHPHGKSWDGWPEVLHPFKLKTLPWPAHEFHKLLEDTRQKAVQLLIAVKRADTWSPEVLDALQRFVNVLAAYQEHSFADYDWLLLKGRKLAEAVSKSVVRAYALCVNLQSRVTYIMDSKDLGQQLYWLQHANSYLCDPVNVINNYTSRDMHTKLTPNTYPLRNVLENYVAIVCRYSLLLMDRYNHWVSDKISEEEYRRFADFVTPHVFGGSIDAGGLSSAAQSINLVPDPTDFSALHEPDVHSAPTGADGGQASASPLVQDMLQVHQHAMMNDVRVTLLGCWVNHNVARCWTQLLLLPVDLMVCCDMWDRDSALGTSVDGAAWHWLPVTIPPASADQDGMLDHGSINAIRLCTRMVMVKAAEQGVHSIALPLLAKGVWDDFTAAEVASHMVVEMQHQSQHATLLKEVFLLLLPLSTASVYSVAYGASASTWEVNQSTALTESACDSMQTKADQTGTTDVSLSNNKAVNHLAASLQEDSSERAQSRADDSARGDGHQAAAGSNLAAVPDTALAAAVQAVQAHPTTTPASYQPPANENSTLVLPPAANPDVTAEHADLAEPADSGDPYQSMWEFIQAATGGTGLGYVGNYDTVIAVSACLMPASKEHLHSATTKTNTEKIYEGLYTEEYCLVAGGELVQPPSDASDVCWYQFLAMGNQGRGNKFYAADFPPASIPACLDGTRGVWHPVTDDQREKLERTLGLGQQGQTSSGHGMRIFRNVDIHSASKHATKATYLRLRHVLHRPIKPVTAPPPCNQQQYQQEFPSLAESMKSHKRK